MSFFNVNAADLLVGNPVENVNKLFDVLERYAPSILFLDEIDSIAQNRVNSNGASTLAVNSLLTAIDGFSKSVLPVFVLGATNHPQLLDPALLRSGRLEKNIYCDVPNAEQREACLVKQMEKANGQSKLFIFSILATQGFLIYEVFDGAESNVAHSSMITEDT